MTDHEKVHYLTEAIFKNILDNFNPGVKQLVASGRALQKALHNVATHAKNYNECIYTLAQSAQVCKGATSEIGAALLQIAEVHKEINTQVIDNIKSFHSDLLIPLETKQENDFKHLQLIHKKYATGQKLHRTAYEKSESALKKHKKKSKAKFGFDQKELQHAREVKETFQKLEDYQFQNLRLVLLEERKRYCFLLDRVCAMVRNYASHHSKAHEMFTHRLSEWTELVKGPHILPESSEAVISAFKNQENLYNAPEEPIEFERRSSSDYTERQASSSGRGEDSNSFTYGTSHRLPVSEASPGPYAGPVPNGGMPTADRYPVSVPVSSLHSAVVAPSGERVRALYTHSGTGETQMSFVTGDVIAVIGDRREGWQYGENTRSHRMGWFPVSFTEILQEESPSVLPDYRPTTQRVKSLGNLSDLHDVNQDYRMHVHTSGGHSDSDSASVKMRARHRDGGVEGRPISMVANLPNSQYGVRTRNSTGGFGRRPYQPRHPSIAEDEMSPSSPESKSQTLAVHRPSVINPAVYRMLVPTPSQRHTLAYATRPDSNIYHGRRHSTVEEQIRSNAQMPATRFLQRLREGGIGQPTSLTIATELAKRPSSPPVSDSPQMPCIPPPEEFSDRGDSTGTPSLN